MLDPKAMALEQLCKASLEAGIVRLREIGAWPLPPAARRPASLDSRDFQGVSELDAFIELLASDDRITSLYVPRDAQPEYYCFGLWERLLICVLTETEGMVLENEVFAKWYRRFVEELFTERSTWRTIDTVTGLDLHVADFQLDEMTSVTSTPGYALDPLVQEQDLDFSSGWPGGHDNATIVTTLSIPKTEYAGSNTPYPHLLRLERSLAVIEAIRLLKPGAPRLHCHVTVHLSDFPLRPAFAYCRSEGESLLYEKATSVLGDDIPEVQEIWQELMLTRYEEHLPIRYRIDAMGEAMGRFSSSYEHRGWLDNIVDLTIALEALFKPSDSNQELSYRLRTRAAWLLGTTEAESAWIYEQIGVMYKIRSSAVHGNAPKERDIGNWLAKLSGLSYDWRAESYYKLVDPATEVARCIVRKAIRACTKLSKAGAGRCKWPFPKDFDKAIVQVGERRAWQDAAGVKLM